MNAMRKPRNTLTLNIIRKFIEDGAIIVKFQKFLGNQEQYYKTVLSQNGKNICIYHKMPFNFIVQGDGKIILSDQLLKIGRNYPS